MLFNSFGYVFLFLPIAILAIVAAKDYFGARAAQLVVLITSLLFYGWLKPFNLFYLAASIIANWYIAYWMDQSSGSARKRCLQLGLILNISYLCLFKYINFLFGTLPFMRGHGRLIPHLEFPLGISFFTLTQIAYLVDCYEGMVPSYTLFDYATFVSFFPYIISGPIAKAKRMIHQFGAFGGTQGKRSDQMARGMYLFSLGLFKKAVLAESFAQVADFGFDAATGRSSFEVLFFGTVYAMQIYFDFSGYTDMAIGTAGMLGIEIPRNFDKPYRSISITEFWQRWHISLSSFITAYLYTPILRLFKRPTLAAAIASTLAAMTIAGAWHGPSWTFVIFGMLHGAALALNMVWRKKIRIKLPTWLSWALTFSFVVFAFLFFRAANIHTSLALMHELFRSRNIFGVTNLASLPNKFSAAIVMLPILFGCITAFADKSSEQMARDFRPGIASSLASACAWLIACLYMNSQVSSNFIYFKF